MREWPRLSRDANPRQQGAAGEEGRRAPCAALTFCPSMVTAAVHARSGPMTRVEFFRRDDFGGAEGSEPAWEASTGPRTVCAG